MQGLLHDRRAPAEASLSVASFMENSSGCSALHCMLSTDDMHKFGSVRVRGLQVFCGAMVLTSTALTIFTCAMFHTDNASTFFMCNYQIWSGSSTYLCDINELLIMSCLMPGVDMRVPLFWGCVPWLEGRKPVMGWVVIDQHSV